MIDIQYRSAVQLVRAIDAFGAQPSGGPIVGPATTRIDAGTILELRRNTGCPQSMRTGNSPRTAG
jgi:hypothetical protein